MEKINVAELLKDCPSGMELDCTMYENVTFVEVCKDINTLYPIYCITTDEKGNSSGCSFTKNGYASTRNSAKCVIFPKGKTTWEGFQRPFKDGEIVATDLGSVFILKSCPEDKIHYHSYVGVTCCNEIRDQQIPFAYKHVCHLATEEEKEKLFQAIKDNGYRWNPETKTLEKLIEPKFKVGDRVRHISAYASGIVVKVTDKGYHIDYPNGEGVCYISFTLEKDYELAPNKFDINTLVPFESRVLIRDNKLQKWYPAIWGFYDSEALDYQYKLVGVIARYCIPYEGNEHLLGTANDCDEFYKTWE